MRKCFKEKFFHLHNQFILAARHCGLKRRVNKRRGSYFNQSRRNRSIIDICRVRSCSLAPSVDFSIHLNNPKPLIRERKKKISNRHLLVCNCCERKSQLQQNMTDTRTASTSANASSSVPPDLNNINSLTTYVSLIGRNGFLIRRFILGQYYFPTNGREISRC